MILIEFLETVLHERERHEAGDRRHLSNALAARFCSHGWAKSVNGEIETGERRVIKATVDPNNATHETASPEVGV